MLSYIITFLLIVIGVLLASFILEMPSFETSSFVFGAAAALISHATRPEVLR